MQTPKLLPLPVAVAAIKARIEHWRLTRPHRCPMPKDLWSEAARLAREHGIYAISKSLRLNYEGLKSWTEDSSEADRATRLPVKPTVARPPRAPSGGGQLVEREAVPARKPTFIQLDPPLTMSASGTTVELCSRDGTKMSVHLPGTVAVDVVALIAAFVKRR